MLSLRVHEVLGDGVAVAVDDELATGMEPFSTPDTWIVTDFPVAVEVNSVVLLALSMMTPFASCLYCSTMVSTPVPTTPHRPVA
jgi:hypothetical protein